MRPEAAEENLVLVTLWTGTLFLFALINCVFCGKKKKEVEKEAKEPPPLLPQSSEPKPPEPHPQLESEKQKSADSPGKSSIEDQCVGTGRAVRRPHRVSADDMYHTYQICDTETGEPPPAENSFGSESSILKAPSFSRSIQVSDTQKSPEQKDQKSGAKITTKTISTETESSLSSSTTTPNEAYQTAKPSTKIPSKTSVPVNQKTEASTQISTKNPEMVISKKSAKQ